MSKAKIGRVTSSVPKEKAPCLDLEMASADQKTVAYVAGQSRSQRVLIRFLDIAIASVGLLLCLPLFFVIAIAILWDSGPPVFFSQIRLGYRKQPIQVIKFRTMVENAERDGPMWAQVNDDRVTRIGHVLRRTRLDELPQLVNVLRGDMGFIGPRPIRAHFARRLEEKRSTYADRFRVKPGVTGWAQLYAPYGSTVDEQLAKLPHDLRYLSEGLTLRTYLKILGLTIISVLRAEGQ